jgi:hypothetical protein
MNLELASRRVVDVCGVARHVGCGWLKKWMALACIYSFISIPGWYRFVCVAWSLEPLNTHSCDMKIGLLSFILAWRFLEFYSLPELVTCHQFPSLVKAYSGPAEFLERHLTTSVLKLVYDVT